MFKRYYDNLESFLSPNKVLVIYGPRRAGKTTILQKFLSETKLKYRLDSGDNIQLQQILGSQDFSKIKDYVSGYELIAIDEAQNIPNIGMGLKIIVDEDEQWVVKGLDLFTKCKWSPFEGWKLKGKVKKVYFHMPQNQAPRLSYKSSCQQVRSLPYYAVRRYMPH